MIEAVGHEHLQAYFRTLGAMLRPGGTCVLQASVESGVWSACGGWRGGAPLVPALAGCTVCRTCAVCCPPRAHLFPAPSHAAHIRPPPPQPPPQVIAEPDERYAAYCASSDFIREHIFPGGHLPCMGAMVDAARGTGLSGGWVGR